MSLVLVLANIVLAVATALFTFTAGSGIALGIQYALLGGLIVFLLSVVAGRLSIRHSKGMFYAVTVGNAVLTFAGFTFGAGGSALLGGIMAVVYIVGVNLGMSIPMLGQAHPR